MEVTGSNRCFDCGAKFSVELTLVIGPVLDKLVQLIGKSTNSTGEMIFLTQISLHVPYVNLNCVQLFNQSLQHICSNDQVVGINVPNMR